MNLEPEECYRLYLAIKTHFETNYDYFKYKGKLRIGDFRARKDRFSFHKLAKKYDNEDIINFLVSNCVYLSEKDFWITNLLDKQSDDIYKQYIQRRNNFEKHFEDDINKLFEQSSNFIKCDKGQLPYILKAVQAKEVSYETLIALDELLHLFKTFDKKIDDDLIWPKIKKKCLNFKPFLWFNHKELRKILGAKIKLNKSDLT